MDIDEIRKRERVCKNCQICISKRFLKTRTTVEVRKVVEKWEIWDEEEEAAKSEMEAKKLVPEKFHK